LQYGVCIGHVYSSSSIDQLNNQISSGDAALDYLIQDVCVDGNDNPIEGDPATCGSHRNVRIGEAIPYLMTDMDMANSSVRYQGIFAYPVPGTDGILKVVVSKTQEAPLDSTYWFRFNLNTDGYDLDDTSGSMISTIRTSDGGCLDQEMSLNPSQRSGGWLVFPIGSGELTGGTQNHNSMFTMLSPNSPCQSNQINNNSVQDIWNPPSNTTFDSGKTLLAIATYHLANTDSSLENNAVERVFYTREYGFTRWEAWIPLSRCLDPNFSGSPANQGNTTICYPNNSAAYFSAMGGRCSINNIPATATWGNQPWVRTDCRDDTFYLRLNTPVFPVDTQMAQNDGLVDIDTYFLTGNARITGCGAAFDCNSTLPGSYQASCFDYGISGSILSGICLNGSGQMFVTSLNLAECSAGDIGNTQGALICSGSRGSLTTLSPSGGFTASCSNWQTSRTILSATCTNESGAGVQTTLDLKNCSSPWSIQNINNNNGNLSCG
jgi:hypothetical protein